MKVDLENNLINLYSTVKGYESSSGKDGGPARPKMLHFAQWEVRSTATNSIHRCRIRWNKRRKLRYSTCYNRSNMFEFMI